MPKYRFQFETGHLYDGSVELEIKDFIAEIEGKINSSLAMTIKAHGGQPVPDEPKPKKTKAKRKAKVTKWSDKEGEK